MITSRYLHQFFFFFETDNLFLINISAITKLKFRISLHPKEENKLSLNMDFCKEAPVEQKRQLK